MTASHPEYIKGFWTFWLQTPLLSQFRNGMYQVYIISFLEFLGLQAEEKTLHAETSKGRVSWSDYRDAGIWCGVQPLGLDAVSSIVVPWIPPTW